jgi:hypothetical protein
MSCTCGSVIEELGKAGDLPQMIATLACYERMFGPFSMQTLSLAALVGETLAGTGENDLGRRLLERVARDIVRAGGRTHRVRLAALASLRDLHLKSGDSGAAIAAQTELVSCRLALEGPEAPQAVEAKSCLVALLMGSGATAEA